MPNRGKYIEVMQTPEHKFIFTIEASTENSEEKVNNEQGNIVVSNIELNPEDIILFQKFLDSALNELMNL